MRKGRWKPPFLTFHFLYCLPALILGFEAVDEERKRRIPVILGKLDALL
jgi:hypothetical protein